MHDILTGYSKKDLADYKKMKRDPPTSWFWAGRVCQRCDRAAASVHENLICRRTSCKYHKGRWYWHGIEMDQFLPFEVN